MTTLRCLVIILLLSVLLHVLDVTVEAFSNLTNNEPILAWRLVYKPEPVVTIHVGVHESPLRQLANKKPATIRIVADDIRSSSASNSAITGLQHIDSYRFWKRPDPIFFSALTILPNPYHIMFLQETRKPVPFERVWDLRGMRVGYLYGSDLDILKSFCMSLKGNGSDLYNSFRFRLLPNLNVAFEEVDTIFYFQSLPIPVPIPYKTIDYDRDIDMDKLHTIIPFARMKQVQTMHVVTIDTLLYGYHNEYKEPTYDYIRAFARQEFRNDYYQQFFSFYPKRKPEYFDTDVDADTFTDGKTKRRRDDPDVVDIRVSQNLPTIRCVKGCDDGPYKEIHLPMEHKVYNKGIIFDEVLRIRRGDRIILENQRNRNLNGYWYVAEVDSSLGIAIARDVIITEAKGAHRHLYQNDRVLSDSDATKSSATEEPDIDGIACLVDGLVVNDIKSKIECESSVDRAGRAKHIGTWDRPCKLDKECPFYEGGERGGCLNGYCELPVGSVRKGYRGYDEAEVPLCYTQDEVGVSECSGPRETWDVAFPKDQRRQQQHNNRNNNPTNRVSFSSNVNDIRIRGPWFHRVINSIIQ